MAFEVYEPKNGMKSRIPSDTVSLTEKGCTLSVELFAELGHPTHATALFDRDARIIAIAPSLSGLKFSTSRAVCLSGFYDRFGITESGHYRAIVKDGRLEIPLNVSSS